MKTLQNLRKAPLLAVYLTALLVAGCSPSQYVYSDKLKVTAVSDSNGSPRGKFKYDTFDGDGTITIWSDQEFKVGDQLIITLSN